MKKNKKQSNSPEVTHPPQMNSIGDGSLYPSSHDITPPELLHAKIKDQ